LVLLVAGAYLHMSWSLGASEEAAS
jgi:hypothetical protein